MLDIDSDFMRPVVKAWDERIKQGIKARKPFDDTAATCMEFYSGAVGWMYEDKYRRKYTKGRFSPRFRVTLNKAFELVALFGPVLYHRNPTRTVKPYEAIDFGPESLGNPDDPAIQMLYEQLAREDQIDHSRAKVRCALMERYLSITPRIQPGGGLEQAAQDAITEGLIKGGGVLVPQSYTTPGGTRTLTGCFYDSIDNWVFDPDAEDLYRARWIAQRCTAPYWELERAYKLPDGSMAKYAKRTGNAEDEQLQGYSGIRRREGSAKCDMVTYWKIWSKSGVFRLRGGNDPSANGDPGLAKAFQEAVGDFAYLVIVEGGEYPAPLNATAEALRTATYDQAKEMFQWPVPYWAANRVIDGGVAGGWPMAMLKFYGRPRWIWPVSPMAPALGELTILNIVMSGIINRVWDGSRTFIAVLKAAADKVKPIIERGDDLCVFELDNIHKSIDQIVSFLNQPQMQEQMWRMADWLGTAIDKRTGLSEIWYAVTGRAASRSATDVETKREMASIRTDDMAKEVEQWLAETSGLEKACSYWAGVKGPDVLPMVGRVGSYLWDQLVADEDPDVIFHQMDCTIESGTSKRPNKDRDIANMNQMFPVLMAQADKHADATADTGPLNAVLHKMGQVIEQPMDDIVFPPRVPVGMQGGADEQQAAQQEQEQSAVEHAQRTQQSEETHNQKMRHAQQMQAQKIRMAEAQARIARMKAKQTAKAG